MQTLVTRLGGHRVTITRQPTGIGPPVWCGELTDDDGRGVDTAPLTPDAGRGVQWRRAVQPGANPGDVLYGLRQLVDSSVFRGDADPRSNCTEIPRAGVRNQPATVRGWDPAPA